MTGGKVGRRKFLGLLGLSPLAAKVAADELVLKEMTTASYGLGAPAIPQPPMGGQSVGGLIGPTEPYWMKPLRWLQKNKLPGWTVEQIREETRHVHCLDPDIAAKRSWSPAVKLAEQRERNFRRRMEWTMRGPQLQSLRDNFHKQTGLYI